ncbi:hypothetical protein CLV79_102214 [Limimaricola soesokkakensis]|uniref:Uncharacterized protein n=1 Tax=Limimaricola soesokkakensis TaxID=1343159 RepID=A0A1X6YXA8_9RHOB|nr:hypothetical protein [Limimaricola soesokkakensis]PSK87730.1 hypothetical protein CLV79_102214 [Limimaricola soesokkakensis]SLN33525.1 hypothetical protein LOS8367_01297 [Limimaricola soesokkakensis]
MAFQFRFPARRAARPARAGHDAPRTAMRPEPLLGIALVALTVCVTLKDWAPATGAGLAAALLVPVVVALLAWRLRGRRLGFVVVALLVTAALWAQGGDWSAQVMAGFGSAAFIGAFFVALATLRSAAETSPAIRACGQYLAAQPPGRRYLALTLGGQAFSVLLNYGSIALLGSLSVASSEREPDPEIRFHRTRRMLLAIQRGFVSVLPWSPLSFSVAITGALLPGAPYKSTVLPAMVTGLIVAGTGWAMDQIFKPKLLRTPVRHAPEGGPKAVLPLVLLLALLGLPVWLLHVAFEVRVVGAVLLVVPLLALGWVLLQEGPRGALTRAGRYTACELPRYRPELTLLMMAGYIGTAGAGLLAPHVAEFAPLIEALPGPLILGLLVWFIPVTGQVGMNPILAVTLLFPLLPSPEAMAVSPVALFIAITAGWAISGITSPFTATTLLTGNFAGKSALHVGLKWNGAYALVTGVLLTLWAVGFGLWS